MSQGLLMEPRRTDELGNSKGYCSLSQRNYQSDYLAFKQALLHLL
jgi:hypothetical protein